MAQALTEVVDLTRTDVVLIVDEVQQALAGDDGSQMLLAINAARDAINPRPDTPGHFLFIGTGSHRAQVVGMTLQGKHAFAGATSVDYPTLDKATSTTCSRALRARAPRCCPACRRPSTRSTRWAVGRRK